MAEFIEYIKDEVSVEGLGKAGFKISGLGEGFVAIFGFSGSAESPQALANLAIVAGTLGVIWFASVIIPPIYYDITLKKSF
ncbi:MAG: hypothetical protein AAB430_03200 [Patescibacteria group bacterium]